MLKELDQTLTKNPKSLVGVMLVVLFFLFIPVPLIEALVLLPLLMLVKNKTYLIGLVIAGVILTASLWLVDKISLIEIIRLNNQLKFELINQNTHAIKSAELWLSSLPLACLIAPMLRQVFLKRNYLHKDLKRIAKGVEVKKKSNSKAINKAMSKITTSTVENGSILGVDQDSIEPVVLKDQDANLHTLAIGTTGSGKTTTVSNIITSAIDRKLPLFYIDGKGDLELANRIKAYAEKKERPFYLFSMMGESVCYNPLASGGITSKKDRIIELREWSEDHYRKIAEGYLQSVFSILEKCDVEVDLISLAKYLMPDSLYDLAKQHKRPELVEQIERLEKREKDISSLRAEIENIANSEIGGLFDVTARSLRRRSPCIDDKNGLPRHFVPRNDSDVLAPRNDEILTLQKALDQNAIVYFCLQPLAFPAYAETLGKLIINDIKSLAATQLQNKQKKKIYTIFDEFSVFAGDQIVNLINQGRSAGIHAVLSTQSLSDISKKGGDSLVGQVINNCNNFIIHRQNYHDDAELLATTIGTINQFHVTSQLDSKNGSTGLGTVAQAKGFIVHPDDIKRLENGVGIYVNKRKFQVRHVSFKK